MARNNVVLNKAGMRALLTSPEVVAMLEDRARPVLAAAQADPHDASGDYERGLQIQTTTGGTRARVKVVSTDWKGHIVESKFGVLSRALDAAGGS